MEDLELLRAYVNGDGDQPLTELVRRHLHWVYASALRQVRDPQLAEDVAQAVFIALAQKARSLAGGAVISAWLFKVTRYVSARALRTEGRRRQHEQKAAAMRPEVPADDSGVDWQELSPLLDDLVGRLGQKHQHLILLRFYQQKSFAEVAAALGISEEAARKRAQRAIDELRAGFARRGVAVGTPAALVGALGVHCSASAGAELVSAATAGALAAGKGAIAASAPLAIAKGAMVTMAWSKASMVAAIAVVALVCGTGLVVATQAAIPSASTSATTNPAGFTTERKVRELAAILEQEEQRYQNIAFAHHREITMREIVPAGQPREPQLSTQTIDLQAVYQGECYWQSWCSTRKFANDPADVTRSAICSDGKEAKSREGEKPVTISPAAPKVNSYSPFVMFSFHPGMLPLSASLTDQFPAALAKLGMPGTVHIRRAGDDVAMGLRCIVLEATLITKSESMLAKVWICPERNHLPLRFEARSIDAYGRETRGPSRTLEVTELAEVSPGVYFPVRLQERSTWGEPGSQMQSDEIWTFSKLQFQPNYPAERFRDLDVAPWAH